jgi:hypothetical protein
MTSSKIGDNRVVHSLGRETVYMYNLWVFMSDEASDGIKVALRSVD